MENGKTLVVAGVTVVIDRPAGFERVFSTREGPMKKKYPVDYGYFPGVINPEDGEEADVFVGTGRLCGRFMKGRNLTGTWVPDERKWYVNLTPEQLQAVRELFTIPSPDLLRDEVEFPDLAAVLHDLAQLAAPDG